MINNGYELHERGDNWFHFRLDHSSLFDSFSVTYCHDGAVCMTGDMGSLVWMRRYYPDTIDYGFPFKDTGIEYFAQKVARGGGSQVGRGWNSYKAITDIDLMLRTEISMYERHSLRDIRECLVTGDYGQCGMINAFNRATHDRDEEEVDDIGMDYTPLFKSQFDALRAVSDIILRAAGDTQ